MTEKMFKRIKLIVIVLRLCLISSLEFSRLWRYGKAAVNKTELPMPYISNKGTCKAIGCDSICGSTKLVFVCETRIFAETT